MGRILDAQARRRQQIDAESEPPSVRMPPGGERFGENDHEERQNGALRGMRPSWLLHRRRAALVGAAAVAVEADAWDQDDRIHACVRGEGDRCRR
jgi:hypothetical protein